MPTGVYPHKKKTHCRRGHELTSKNTYVYPHGARECRTCRRKRNRQHSLANKKKLQVRKHEHYVANKKEILARKRLWYTENTEEAKRRSRNQARANPAKRREYERRRKARKSSALGNFQPWMEKYLRFAQRMCCFYCEDPLDPQDYHLEHKIPLSRDGLHDWRNVVLACPRCNLRKGTMTAEEFVVFCQRARASNHIDLP